MLLLMVGLLVLVDGVNTKGLRRAWFFLVSFVLSTAGGLMILLLDKPLVIYWIYRWMTRS